MEKKLLTTMVFAGIILLGEIAMAEVKNLKECPKKPNCVSTQTTQAEKKMEPIVYTQDLASIKKRIISVVGGQSRTKLVEESGNYLHFTFTSLLLRFVDDVEFLIDDSKKMIHFRSASRVGRSDLGANRKRMTELTGLIKKP